MDATNERSPNDEALPRRVLVVEDDSDARDLLVTFLRAHGYHVLSAASAEEALLAAKAYQPEVVVLDIGLPQMDGLQACREMRMTQWGRDAMVVALSGRGQSNDKQAAREAGFDLHFTKPVDPRTLLRAIEAGRPSP